jgi:hypothetical protein
MQINKSAPVKLLILDNLIGCYEFSVFCAKIPYNKNNS